MWSFPSQTPNELAVKFQCILTELLDK